MHSIYQRAMQRLLSVLLTLFILNGALACAQTPTTEATPEQIAEISDSKRNDAKRDVLADKPTLAPVVWSVIGKTIHPVRGTDGRIHLAYELHVSNITGSPVRVRSIEVLDAKDNTISGVNRIVEVLGEDVTGKIRKLGADATLTAADYTDRLGQLDSGLVYLDVTYGDLRDVPRRIKHRFTVVQGNNGDAVATTVIGDAVEVSRKEAIIIAPPLKGANWLNGEGCCQIIGPHRYAIFPLNGSLKAPEHFAIDFVRLDAQGRAFVGDLKVLTNWVTYNAEIVSATPGRVIEVVNNMLEQVPGQLPADTTVENAAGNHVIVDIGNGRYALYAHMIPGSVAVAEGDFVQPGQLLGRLGNSGNTDAPHLHFQIMDAPTPLNANGLPFVFDSMQFQGRVVGTLASMEQTLFAGQAATIDARGAGARTGQMPLALDIVGFRQ